MAQERRQPRHIVLVDEGGTVVLSSHLLDEVERTCDAVAIVDHGQVIRQGPIDELTAGADVTVEEPRKVEWQAAPDEDD